MKWLYPAVLMGAPWAFLAAVAGSFAANGSHTTGLFFVRVGSHYVILIALLLVLTGLIFMCFRVRASQLRKICLVWTIAFGVAIAALAVYGERYLIPTYSQRARIAWHAKTTPEALRTRLQQGMTPQEVVSAMELPVTATQSTVSFFKNGLHASRALNAMGASSTTISVKNDVSDAEYFIWCKPLCAFPGCCDATITLRFESGQLQEVGIYDPTREQSNPKAYDMARHVTDNRFVRIIGGRHLFSPEKTFAQIQKSGPANVIVIESPPVQIADEDEIVVEVD